MSQPKYIQDENVLVIIAVAFFCFAVICWAFWSDKKIDDRLEKENESEDLYSRSLSWRVYIIAGTGLLIMLWELIKRFMNFCS